MKPITVAVIGCGTIAKSAHMPAYAANPNAKVKYVVDIIPERAQALAEKYGVPHAITDYKEILSDPEVDAVSVCVPNYLHAEITIACLNAGKDVLCEKPASVNFGLVKDMKAAADNNGRVLNIGVVNRFNTAVNHVRDMIHNGELGDVYHVYCSFRSHRSIPGLGGWFTTKAISGGGVLIDWGVHFLDLIFYCLQPVEAKAVSSSAYSELAKDKKGYTFVDMWAGPPNYEGTYDVEEFVTGLIRTTGPTINFNGAWAQNIDEKAMFIEFLGNKGGIKLEYGGNFTFYTAKDGILYKTQPSYTTGDMFYDEIDNFLTSCRENRTDDRANVKNNLITAQVMEAIYKSAEAGKEVVL